MTLSVAALEGFRSLQVPAAQVLLHLTISNRCGQSFRWYERKPATSGSHEGAAASEWSFCLSDRVVVLRQAPQAGLIYHKTLLPGGKQPSQEVQDGTEAWLRDYLNLSVDLEAKYKEWSARDPVFADLAGRFSGIRMLRQPVFECLIAFICSSNNNIARIGQMVQKLCTHFSPCLLTERHPSASSPDVEETIAYHPFPSPQALSADGVEGKLRELGFGYRAKYIAKTAQMLCEQHANTPDESPRSTKRQRRDSEASESSDSRPRFRCVEDYLLWLRELPYDEARAELLQYPGIGPKVADCILLMSLDKAESIPVDRHVFAFAEKKYRIRSKSYDEIVEKLQALWGDYAGWAHSILFTADLRSFREYQLGAPVKIEDITNELQSLAEPSVPGDALEVKPAKVKQEPDDRDGAAPPTAGAKVAKVEKGTITLTGSGGFRAVKSVQRSTVKGKRTRDGLSQ